MNLSKYKHSIIRLSSPNKKEVSQANEAPFMTRELQKVVMVKGTVMQIEKAQLIDRLHVSKVSITFRIQLFIVL